MFGSSSAFLAAVLFVIAFGAMAPAQTPATQPVEQARVFEKQITVRLQYLLHLPAGYEKDPAKKWPLMLFLHGAGERGDDLKRVKIHGPIKYIQKGGDFPFILVSPQCPAGQWWEPAPLLALLDDIQAKYRVDPDRVYVTGLSMGGYGTWDLAIRNPGRFAAIAPICGGGRPFLARQLKDLPVWVFHGDSDPVVPVERSDEMVEALKRAGGNVRYTRYPGVNHDSWTATYANPELYAWFLSHKRPAKPAGEPTARPPAGE